MDSPDNKIQIDKYGESDRETEERLGNLFKQLDRNGNGRIDIQELTASLKDLGMAHQYAEVILFRSIVQYSNNGCTFSFISLLFGEIPDRCQRLTSFYFCPLYYRIDVVRHQKFLKQSDHNHSGDVALNEFINYVREHEKNLQLQFSHLDRNNDGKLSSIPHVNNRFEVAYVSTAHLRQHLRGIRMLRFIFKWQKRAYIAQGG